MSEFDTSNHEHAANASDFEPLNYIQIYADLPLLQLTIESARKIPELESTTYAGDMAPICMENDPEATELFRLARVLHAHKLAHPDGFFSKDVPAEVRKARNIFNSAHAILDFFRSFEDAKQASMASPWHQITQRIAESGAAADRLAGEYFDIYPDSNEPQQIKQGINARQFIEYLKAFGMAGLGKDELLNLARHGDLHNRATFFVFAVNSGWDEGMVDWVDSGSGLPKYLCFRRPVEIKSFNNLDPASQRLIEANSHLSKSIAQTLKAALEEIEKHDELIKSDTRLNMELIGPYAIEVISSIRHKIREADPSAGPFKKEDLSYIDDVFNSFALADKIGIDLPQEYLDAKYEFNELYIEAQAYIAQTEAFATSWLNQVLEVQKKYRLSGKDLRSHPQGPELMSLLIKPGGNELEGLNREELKNLAGFMLALYGFDSPNDMEALDRAFVMENEFKMSAFGDQLKDDYISRMLIIVTHTHYEDLLSLKSQNKVIKEVMSIFEKAKKDVEQAETAEIELWLDHFMPKLPKNISDSDRTEDQAIDTNNQPESRAGIFASARDSEDIFAILKRIKQRSSLAEVYAFPPGKKMKEELEDAKKPLVKIARDEGYRLDWGKIDALIDLIDDYEATEQFAGDLIRTREGSLNERFPYFVATLEHIDTGERFVVAENPKYGNATYIFTEGQFLNMPWEEIVTLSKEDARELGAKRIYHDENRPHSEHVKIIKREIELLATLPV